MLDFVFALAISTPPLASAMAEVQWMRKKEREVCAFAIWVRNLLIVNVILFVNSSLYNFHAEEPLYSIAWWFLFSILFSALLCIVLPILFLKPFVGNRKAEQANRKGINGHTEGDAGQVAGWNRNSMWCAGNVIKLSRPAK